jgi:uncharacterized protein YjbJ (UPF0337 family)
MLKTQDGMRPLHKLLMLDGTTLQLKGEVKGAYGGAVGGEAQARTGAGDFTAGGVELADTQRSRLGVADVKHARRLVRFEHLRHMVYSRSANLLFVSYSHMLKTQDGMRPLHKLLMLECGQPAGFWHRFR